MGQLPGGSEHMPGGLPLPSFQRPPEMPRPSGPGGEQFQDLPFPTGGLSLLRGFEDQPPRPWMVPVPPRPGAVPLVQDLAQLGQTQWGRTTVSALSVRGYEALSGRDRGGSRPGLAKYVAQVLPPGGWIVQDVNQVTAEGPTAMQLSQSGRLVVAVAVSQGNVYYAQAGASTWTTANNLTGDTPPLNYTGLVASTALNQNLWFADGVNWVYFQTKDGTVRRWAPSAGSLPVDSSNNTPRLIATWRGRMILSGLLVDPQNWFMSAVSDPTNWDYAPVDITPTQAVAGNNSPLGLVGDVVTALIPYNDDVLIFGGDHTIYRLSGDPMAGGQIDRVSDSIGIAWGQAWCKDPYGAIYFLSNRCGVYSLVPGQTPVRISQQIEQLLQTIDTGASGIRLVWDDRYQGLHVFVTPLAAPAAATHFFWEQRTGAWWQDQFANPNHNPLACCVFDGNTPGDRVVLLGSWDGYVRSVSPTALDDDGTPIASSVVLGPLVTKDFDELLLKDLQAVLGVTSGSVSYAVYTGTSAEQALSNTPIFTGTWLPGRNLTNYARCSGHAIYLKITATSAWAMEGIRARLAPQGKVRRRGV